MTKEELYKIIARDESFRIERTTSKGDSMSQVVLSMSQVQMTEGGGNCFRNGNSSTVRTSARKYGNY